MNTKKQQNAPQEKWQFTNAAIYDEKGLIVAYVLNQARQRQKGELLASAPEMRDVLKMVLDALKFHHPDMHYSISEIERVLRKADGKI